MKEYKTVLFDLDGTLTDPGEGITKSVAYALKQFGIDVPDRTALYPFIGPPLVDSFMSRYGFTHEQALEAVRQYRVYFRDRGIFENTVYPGVPEMLTRLRGHGKTLIVASSKPEEFVRRILSHFGIADRFAFAAGSTMTEQRTDKAEVVAYALCSAGISDTDSAILVGDREYDVFGAHRAGIDALAVSYGYGSREELRAANPEQIADSPEQVAELLLRKIQEIIS